MAPSGLLRTTTLVMSAVAAALVHLAVVEPHQPRLPGMLQLAIVLLIAAALFERTRNRPGTNSLGRGATLALALLAVIPFLAEPLSRWVASHGSPPEVQIALALRNLMVGLAALQSNLRAQRLACLASLFIVLFSLMWTVSGVAIGLLVAYTVLAMWWLLGAYWDGLAGKFAASSARDLPKAPVIGLTLFCVVVLALLPLLKTSHVTTALAGFFPSSGGSGAFDPFARSGVGDGDQLVAAQEDARSFGPIESELFLESEMPSLYDVVDEFYNEPAKFKRRAKVRAIPLSPSTTQESRRRMATTKQAGREFSLIRQPPPTRKEQQDRSTHALFSVAGRVPLHLKLATYNRWDGHKLTYESPAASIDVLATEADDAGRNWASLGDSRASDLFPVVERHVLRFLNLKTKRVPTPAHLSRLHVDQMRDARLFDRTADGGVDYSGDFIPQLTVLHVESRPAKQEALQDARLRIGTAADSSEASVAEPIAALARQWTSGVPRGWRQVSAICERLRSDYRHDREAVTPQDCKDAAVHFLTEARSGNDASFAASAALLLRSLGYEAQVASGFYATPENFDAASGQTAINKDDVHFWAEVQTDDGEWVTVEPTPGYEVLYAQISWSEQVAIAARSTLVWLVQRKWSALSSITLLATLYVLRHRVLATCAVVAWRCRWRASNPRNAVLWTLWLIERRAQLSGAPRPAEIPPGRWWEARLSPASWKGESPVTEFLTAMQWALYGEGATCPLAELVVHSSCHDVALEIGTILRIKKPSA